MQGSALDGLEGSYASAVNGGSSSRVGTGLTRVVNQKSLAIPTQELRYTQSSNEAHGSHEIIWKLPDRQAFIVNSRSNVASGCVHVTQAHPDRPYRSCSFRILSILP